MLEWYNKDFDVKEGKELRLAEDLGFWKLVRTSLIFIELNLWVCLLDYSFSYYLMSYSYIEWL